MKSFFTIVAIASWLCASAQTDTLHAGVYSWSNAPIQKMGSVEKKVILKGKTHDLKLFEIYTLTLPQGQTYLPSEADNSFERLIVIKNGNLTLTLNDTTKTVGKGSVALVLAGDRISFKNNSNEIVTWYIINYQSINLVDIKRGLGAGASFIKDWNQLKVNKSVKGETRAIFDRPTSMFGRFDVHATALNEGYASHDPHRHRVEELILMLTGSVQETITDNKFEAKAGDCIYLSSGILHGPKNINKEQCYYLAIQWHNLKTD